MIALYISGSSHQEVFQLFETTLRRGCSHVNLLHIFRTLFTRTPLNSCFCSSFVMKDASLARTYFLLIGACYLKMRKTVFLKHFSFFFLKHNFECLIKTFHYQSVYNHGKPQCEVSVFEFPFLILL